MRCDGITAHIIHPSGYVTEVKVKSHRAFEHEHGLYDVGNIFTFPDHRRMMLLSAGNPAPHGGAGEDETGITEKQFTSSLLNKLSEMSANKRLRIPKPPAWLLMLVIVALALLLPNL